MMQFSTQGSCRWLPNYRLVSRSRGRLFGDQERNIMKIGHGMTMGFLLDWLENVTHHSGLKPKNACKNSQLGFCKPNLSHELYGFLGYGIICSYGSYRLSWYRGVAFIKKWFGIRCPKGPKQINCIKHLGPTICFPKIKAFAFFLFRILLSISPPFFWGGHYLP